MKVSIATTVSVWRSSDNGEESCRGVMFRVIWFKEGILNWEALSYEGAGFKVTSEDP